ncbi:hypothetical protein BH24PSE2_BH24PSE2_01530 [soil metagenome]
MAPRPEIDAVTAALREDAGIAAAILFGSAARGRLRAESDLDVAVLYADESARGLARKNIVDRLGCLGSIALRDVHLVDLESADCELRRAIFATGVWMFDRSGGALKQIERRTAIEYVDWEYTRRAIDTVLQRRLGQYIG